MTWEERWHPLRQEWVIVSAHRQHRPWSGERQASGADELPRYAADCYLCPRNPRVSGLVNPDYDGVFAFDNDHPCVAADAPHELEEPAPVYRVQPAVGRARVVCYTPRHDLTLAELAEAEIEALLRVFQKEYRELGAADGVRHVLVFENKGEVVGVSNPHPHAQIYATNFVPKTIEIELEAARAHLAATGRVLFQDVLAAERADGRRLVVENERALAFVPYFARYAYETFVAPRRTAPSLAALEPDEVRDLAALLKDVLVRFDNLWQTSFPYVMALHQAPTDGREHAGFHFHVEFQPPLRQPNLLKYLAGPEIGAGAFVSDTSPEEKAAELCRAGGAHYKAAAR